MSALSTPSRDTKRTTRKAAGILAVASLAAGLIAGELVASGRAVSVLGLAAVVLPVVLWKRPDLGPVVLLVGALTVEQDAVFVGTMNSAATDRIPLFHGLGPVHVNPADLLLVVLIVISLRQATATGTRIWPRSALGRCVLFLLAAVAVGFLVGVSHHGSVRVASMEMRPYIYLAATYVLTTVLVTTRAAARALLWALVISTGFKAGQAILIFLSVRSLTPRPDAVVGHEEALFFGVFIFLALALWLFEVQGRLRTTATVLLPFVVVADLVNTRRTAWLILGVGLFVMAIVGFAALPSRRRVLLRAFVAIVLVAAVYLPVYWTHTGALGQPARAIHSIFTPDPRDASSNLYRVQENANLTLNIQRGGLLGRGFGVRIDYVLPIVDISSIDPLIAYIPHNGVLYIVMRMGILGAIAFWSLLATAIITACRLARSRDRELAAIGAVLVCALIGYTLQGYNDQGFFFYRIAFVIGILLGLGDVLRRLNDAGDSGDTDTPRPALSQPRPSTG